MRFLHNVLAIFLLFISYLHGSVLDLANPYLNSNVNTKVTVIQLTVSNGILFCQSLLLGLSILTPSLLMYIISKNTKHIGELELEKLFHCHSLLT